MEVNKNIRGYIICTARAHKTLQLAASHKQKSTNKNNHRTEQLVTIYEHLSYSNITVYKPTRFSKNFNVTYLNTSSLTSVYRTVLVVHCTVPKIQVYNMPNTAVFLLALLHYGNLTDQASISVTQVTRKKLPVTALLIETQPET